MSIIRTEKAYVINDSYTVYTPSITNPGYKFIGWNTKSDGTGTSIKAGSSYTPTSDITLYAQWGKNIQQQIKVNVYSAILNDGVTDYSATFNINGTNFTTDSETNIYNNLEDSDTTNDNQWIFGTKGTLTVKAYGLFISVPTGQSLNGVQNFQFNDLTDQTDQLKTYTFNFTVGEFTEITISKLAIGQHLYFSSKAHEEKIVEINGGTIFGGHTYKIYWYDKYKFKETNDSPYESVKWYYDEDPKNLSAYIFNENDKCFVNVAHRGGATSHTMHVKIGYIDMQETQQFIPFQLTNGNETFKEITVTNLKSSPPECDTEKSPTQAEIDLDYNNNFKECQFDPIILDLSKKNISDKFKIGVSVKDHSAACSGIKVSCIYKLYIID